MRDDIPAQCHPLLYLLFDKPLADGATQALGGEEDH